MLTNAEFGEMRDLVDFLHVWLLFLQ